MAINVTNWFKENMAKLNLSDEDRAAAERLLAGNLGQQLGAAVYPQEAVSGLQSSLDKQKADAAAREAEYKTANDQWATYAYNLGAKYNAVAELEAAGFDVTNLRAAAGGGVTNTNTGAGLTAEQVAEIVRTETAKQVEPARQAALDFAEFLATAGPDYHENYGKRFDAKKFRTFAYENRASYANLQQVYDAFTADERTAKAEADKKAWEEKKEKEIELRLRSSMELPEYAGGGETGGVFDIARGTAAAAATAPTREQNRQEFAKAHQNINLQGL